MVQHKVRHVGAGIGCGEDNFDLALGGHANFGPPRSGAAAQGVLPGCAWDGKGFRGWGHGERYDF